MKTLIGGAVAAALGLVGLVIWWGQFLMVLAGIIPAMLLLGGALAIYLGFDELKDTWKDDETVESPPESSEAEGEGEEVEKYKKEIDDLKEEIETLKKD
jgi:cell division protein FtsB